VAALASSANQYLRSPQLDGLRPCSVSVDPSGHPAVFNKDSLASVGLGPSRVVARSTDREYIRRCQRVSDRGSHTHLVFSASARAQPVEAVPLP